MQFGGFTSLQFGQSISGKLHSVGEVSPISLITQQDAALWEAKLMVLGQSPVELECGGSPIICRSSEKRVDILIRDFS